MRKVICFLFGHNKIDRICNRCGCEFGVPKMKNPPPPPERKNYSLIEGSTKSNIKSYSGSLKSGAPPKPPKPPILFKK